jgi:hypothetical protein
MAIQTPVTFLDRKRMRAQKPPKGPATVKVEHRAGVRAPADIVWEILADIPGWVAWNPLHKEARGEVRIGSTLTATQAIEGQPDQPVSFTVSDWVPNEQLHLRRSNMGGWLRSIRFIEIDTLDEAACIVSTGELFIGMLGPRFVKKHGRTLKRGFTAHGEALKAEAERRFAERGGGNQGAAQ